MTARGWPNPPPAHIARYFAGFGGKLPPDGVYDRLLAEVERPLIAACLDATGGNQLKAAKLLGINRNTLRKQARPIWGSIRVAARRSLNRSERRYPLSHNRNACVPLAHACCAIGSVA